jgi:hypothetical protein
VLSSSDTARRAGEKGGGLVWAASHSVQEPAAGDSVGVARCARFWRLSYGALMEPSGRNRWQEFCYIEAAKPA